jgi:16S rRNA (cytosine1402-N4)-methyltransferase
MRTQIMAEKHGNQYIHEPVLLEEVVNLLQPGDGGLDACVLVDATTGEGGHSEAFLSRFPNVILYCVDADNEQMERARTRLGGYRGRVDFFTLMFGDFFRRYSSFASKKPDRILFDLGISSRHYEESGRGFSFQKDEKLDMRLSMQAATTAKDIVAQWPEKKLTELLETYGEEQHARKIARAIVRSREEAKIETTGQLERIIWKAVPSEYRQRRIHPATKTFQALRIAVNRELEELQTGLEKGFEVLKPKGRMGVISFHSLEDRIVKRFFQEKNRACICPPELPICQCRGKKELDLVTKKPLTPGEEEMKRNPRSRSAKLRVVEKCV